VKKTGIVLEPSWNEALQGEFSQPYFKEIMSFLKREKKSGKIIYPPDDMIFHAFNKTPLHHVKVVILGQDPYHGPGEAMGLCFSVPPSVKIPPSLRNIYKEIQSDVQTTIPTHGDLTQWATQGVFLLNTILTVEHKTAGSHKKIGWHRFTDAVIKIISNQCDSVVFLLWGKFAQTKIPLIDQSKQFILISAHPSPLARNAFFGNHHFSKTNELLIKQGKVPIDWQID